MIRLLILLALGYLVYRIARMLLLSGSRRAENHREGVGTLPRRVDDELVQDPVCKTYIPLREAEKRHIDGRDYYFCSRACADRFLEEGDKARTKDEG